MHADELAPSDPEEDDPKQDDLDLGELDLSGFQDESIKGKNSYFLIC